MNVIYLACFKMAYFVHFMVINTKITSSGKGKPRVKRRLEV